MVGLACFDFRLVWKGNEADLLRMEMPFVFWLVLFCALIGFMMGILRIFLALMPL